MSLLLAAILLLPQDKTPEQLVEQLRSDKVEERNQAARQLKALGETALPALERAARDSDGDLSRAAKEILGELKGALDARQAEATFRKIEETLLAARSLKIRYRLELLEQRGEREEKIRATGELGIKEGNKVFIQARVELTDRPKETLFVSDGARMATLRNGRVSKAAQESWPNMGERMTLGFLRAGLMAIDKITRAPGQDKTADENDLRKMLLVSDFKSGPDEGEAKTLRFRTTVGKTGEIVDVLLTYDPGTFRLHKRVCTPVSEHGLRRMEERFEEFVLNADLPDEKFTLPEEKK